jgi:hypothetical protein
MARIGIMFMVFQTFVKIGAIVQKLYRVRHVELMIAYAKGPLKKTSAEYLYCNICLWSLEVGWMVTSREMAVSQYRGDNAFAGRRNFMSMKSAEPSAATVTLAGHFYVWLSLYPWKFQLSALKQVVSQNFMILLYYLHGARYSHMYLAGYKSPA